MTDVPRIDANDHKAYLKLALLLAGSSPPKPTNFCVGAVLVSENENKILSTGFTLELEGNTHAEQCCLLNYAKAHNVSVDDLCNLLPSDTVIYTTMEPCNKRSPGNMPCADRILATRKAGKGISTVYVGVMEPETFVGENQGRGKLESAGVKFIHVTGLEDEILKVAKSGHVVPKS